MPRAKDAKVWNEDLIRAFTARAQLALREGKQHLQWQKAANAITEVRKDIFMSQSSKRIFNLPSSSTKLSRSAYILAEQIMNGTQSIIPDGGISTTFTNNNNTNPQQRQGGTVEDGTGTTTTGVGVVDWDNYAYVKKIKYRGGSYAILLAFYYSPTKTLTKDEICQLAQPYCDEEMEPNWHAGRARGAWSGHKTLVDHTFITGGGKPRYVAGIGFRSDKHRYTLTRDGEQFTAAMLRKFSNADNGPHNGGGGGIGWTAGNGGGTASYASTPSPAFSRFAGRAPRSGSSSTIPVSKKAPSVASQTDIQELTEWVASAEVNSVKLFKAGKDRRKRLHDACDLLEQQHPGLLLHHQSTGDGRGRQLKVTIQKRSGPSSATTIHTTGGGGGGGGGIARRPNDAMLQSMEFGGDRGILFGAAESSPIPPWSTSSPSSTFPTDSAKRRFDSVDHDSEGEEGVGGIEVFSGRGRICSISKRPRQMSAREAAALAAMERASKLDPKKRATKKRKTEPTSPYLATASKSLATQNQHPQNDSPRSSVKQQRVLDMNSDQESNPWAKLPPSQPVVLDLLDDDDCDDGDNDRKPAAKPGRNQTNSPRFSAVQEAINLEADDSLGSDNPIHVYQESPKYAVVEDLAAEEKEEDVIDLCDSQDSIILTQDMEGTRTPSRASTLVHSSPKLTLPKLTIQIDNRERNRNKTPRLLRTELARLLSSGPLKECWPKTLPAASVEESKLRYGDFSYLSGEKDDGHRLDVVIERKRINDLVQRSVRGDHWKQICKMRDSFSHAVVLLEVNIRRAVLFTAYNAQQLDDAYNPYETMVEDEESVYLFMGRAILSHKSLQFIQTGEEQGSLRMIGAMGMIASALRMTLPHDPETTDTSNEQKRLVDKLTSAGVPYQLANEVGKDVGSIKHLKILYDSCSSDDCKANLFTNLMHHGMTTHDISGTAAGWSEAIYRVFFSIHSSPDKMTLPFKEYSHLVQDHGKLLAALHFRQSSEEALESVFEASSPSFGRRKVLIQLSRENQHFFPNKEDDKSFYKLEITDRDHTKPDTFSTMTMQTKNDYFVSPLLSIHLIQGAAMVSRVKAAINGEDAIESARSVVKTLMVECDEMASLSGKDRRAFVIQGLGTALTAEAKKAGYSPKIKTICDLVIADLMLEHNVVVLQAWRKQNESELIIRQLALACFHYHLLTEVMK